MSSVFSRLSDSSITNKDYASFARDISLESDHLTILLKSCEKKMRYQVSFRIINYTPPHDSGGVLWFHVDCQCARPSVVRSSVFSFPDHKKSKCQWIFIKVGVCIYMVEIWGELHKESAFM